MLSTAASAVTTVGNYDANDFTFRLNIVCGGDDFRTAKRVLGMTRVWAVTPLILPTSLLTSPPNWYKCSVNKKSNNVLTCPSMPPLVTGSKHSYHSRFLNGKSLALFVAVP